MTEIIKLHRLIYVSIAALLGAMILICCGIPDSANVVQQPYPYPVQTPPPTLASVDATKAADAQQIADTIATAKARRSAAYPIPTEVVATDVPISERRIPTGIRLECESIYRRLISQKNCWSELFGETFIFILAGAEPQTLAQGILGIHVYEIPTGITAPFLTYPAPTQHGALTIIEVAFPIITTQAADGTIFQFNYDTRQWLPPAPTP